MADNDRKSVETAHTRFLETQKKTAERNQATAEYLAEKKATAAKTVKLRALRLARDAAEAAAKPVKVAKTARAGKTRAAPAAAAKAK